MTTLKHPAHALPAELDGFRVEVDADRQRADIVLARPPFNIVSMPQRDQLRLVFEALDEDPRVRVIVLRAEGGHFSSGGDIKGFLQASPEHVSKLAWNIAAPARCAKPVIAAARGYCFGVGFEISLACDFRIVSDTAQYALPEQKLGQIPGSGGSARLQKMVGITRTKDIVMRSRRISAQQAYDWGVATEIVADGELEADRPPGRRAADFFAAGAAYRQEAAEHDTEDASLSASIELEGHCYSRLRSSDDFREGGKPSTASAYPSSAAARSVGDAMTLANTNIPTIMGRSPTRWCGGRRHGFGLDRARD